MRCLLKERHCGNCVHCERVHGLDQPVLICRSRGGYRGSWHAVCAGDVCGRFKRRAAAPVPPEGARVIPLSQGKFAVVDAADYAGVVRYSWYAAPSPLRGTPPSQGESYIWYAVRKEGGRTVRMHRVIMAAPRGMVVDHINHDGLDNRRSNLRVCTHRENIRNQRGQRGRSSRYKGVSRDRRLGKWRSQIWHEGRHTYLGLFESEIEAARAYDEKARELFGAYAYLNFGD